MAAGGPRAAAGHDTAHWHSHECGRGDPEAQDRNLAFLEALHELGWTEDRNVQVDYRWAAGDADRLRRYAAELVALAPAVVLASGTSTVGPLQRASATVPIVFAGVADPVGAGFVDSMARPGRNATGFISRSNMA